MPTRIERIEMRSFRGATVAVPLDIDASKPITLIFGENGCGKSTIIDAIDFVLNEAYGSLNDRSSTRPKTHLPSLGSSAAQLAVSITAGGETWTGQLGSDGPKTSGPELRPIATVLRRSHVLQFVNEAPRKRYEALQTFITLPGIEKSEASLRRACKTASEQYNEAVTAKELADEALNRLWRDEGCPGNKAWDWAKSEISRDASSLTESVATLAAILRAFEAAQTARYTLGNLSDRLAVAQSALTVAAQDLERAETGAATDASSLISLLEETERYLGTRKPPDVCPVCESTERAADLKASVVRRLSSMRSLVVLKRKVDEARRKVDESSTVLTELQKTFTSAVRQMWLSNAATLSKGSGVEVDTAQYRILRDTTELADGEAVTEAESLLQIVESCADRITTRRDKDQKTLNQLTAINNYVSTVETKTDAAKSLESMTKRLTRLLEIVETHRKAYVDGLLSSIESIVEQMYSRVHPGEGLGGIRLYLKPNVIGSLEFDGQFQHKSGVPPQAYYSDSHLDTLGICVFLALAKHFNKDNSVVVLDDVLTSADSNHLDRLIGMLHGEAEHFNQIIITTHYRPWLERYRHSGSKEVALIELSQWSLAQGVRATKAKLHIEELKEVLASGDRQIVASKAGIFLERLLDFIAMRYGGKVPRQPDPKYTLGVLANSIDSKLAKLLKVEEWPAGSTAALSSTDLKPLIQDATQWAWVRNEVGCHFSISGQEVPDADVRLFAKKTVELAERLLCGGCGEFPVRNKSGSYWECRCGVRRLYPLAAPGAGGVVEGE